MIHLNIQQGLNVEIVNTQIIRKLHEIAQSVPLPEEGEQDLAYMSGNLLVAKTYRALVEYLTNRFDDLHINVTAGYYIPFHDSAVNDVLKNTIGDGIGVLDTLLSSVTNLNNLGLVNNTEITDFREGCLLTNPNITTSAGFVNGCTNLDVVGIPPNYTYYGPYVTNNCRPSKIVISDWKKWIGSTFTNGNNICSEKHDLCTLNDDNSLTVIKNIILPEGTNFPSSRQMDGGFYNSTVEEVTLPTTVTRLADFQGSDITTLNFPLNSSLTTIILYCFYGCNKLTLDVSDLPLTITTIGNDAFEGCSNITGILNLPNLTSLGAYSFKQSGITSIVDLGSITNVLSTSFNRCSNLTTVVLPNTCTTIKDGAFAFDTSMTSIDLGGTTTVEYNAFMLCTSLTTVTGMSLLTAIGSDAFLRCPITGALNLPNLISIGNNAFRLTGITSITDLGSITSIPNECFKGCNISSINQSVVDLITSWGFTSLYVSGNAALTIKLGPNTKRIAAGIIGVNNPNAVVYLPLITRSISSSPNDVVDGDCYCPFNKRYSSGVARNVYGLIYMPNLSTIEGGYGTYPYQNGLAIDTNADLFYIKSVSTLTPGTFSQCDISHIVINNTTPPNLVDTQGLQNELGGLKICIFSYNGSLSGIYVPDSAVSSYKTAWGDVLAVTPVNNTTLSQDIIKPISSLNNGVIYATENDWISDGRPSALIAEYMGLSSADLATFVSANNLTYYTPPSSQS